MVETPLLDAAKEGNVDEVSRLLDSGYIHVNEKDGFLYTPLLVALEGKHWPVVKLLLAHKDVDFNAYEYEDVRPLHLAAMRDHIESVRTLLDRPGIDVNARVSLGVGDGRSAIHWVCFKGNVEMFRLFAAHPDVDVNITSRRCWGTPLQAACEGGSLEIVKELLKRSDLDDIALTKSGPHRTSAYGSAAITGRNDVLQILLEHLPLAIVDAREIVDLLEEQAEQIQIGFLFCKFGCYSPEELIEDLPLRELIKNRTISARSKASKE